MKLFALLFFLLVTHLSSHAQKSFLALGDSYTIGESVPEKERWPVRLVKKLNELGYEVDDPKIIARTGWRTDELKLAIRNADLKPLYDMVGLLIGVNNQYQGKSVESYKPEFEELLEMALALAGDDTSRVFVVSIPDYGYTPFGASKQEKISSELDEYNKANKEITKAHKVKYFYITDISRSKESGLVAEDNLHPSGKQYAKWVDLILADSTFFKVLR